MLTPDRIATEFDWADIVLVEWGHHILTWVTLLDRAPRALMTRLHGSEAFTPFPLLSDYEVLDRVLYVSAPIRDLVAEMSPEFAAVDSRQVGNLLTRGLGAEPSGPREEHLLVQVGWAHEIKDVLFTLDVLESLRRYDRRFRLQLVGNRLPDRSNQDTEYQQQVRERLKRMADSVEILGHRSDVPEIFARAGFVISSSRREGTHESVMEGMAAGCVPVIRNWPDAAPFGGSRSLYGDRWVVDDVDQAVQSISTPLAQGRWDEESQAARASAIALRSPRIVVETLEKALTSRSAEL